jgi:hypothetical protein
MAVEVAEVRLARNPAAGAIELQHRSAGRDRAADGRGKEQVAPRAMRAFQI